MVQTLRVGLKAHLRRVTRLVALSLPLLFMLKRVEKMPLFVTFTGVVTLGTLSIGPIINAISNWLI